MGLKAERLNSEREEFDFPYLGEELHIVYNPQGYTPKLERKIQESSGSEFKSEGLVYMLKTMLVDWDLEKTIETEEGEKKDVLFGVEDEDLMTLPVKFLADVTMGIAEEIKRVTEAGKPSGATSPQKETSEKSLAGTAS